MHQLIVSAILAYSGPVCWMECYTLLHFSFFVSKLALSAGLQHFGTRNSRGRTSTPRGGKSLSLQPWRKKGLSFTHVSAKTMGGTCVITVLILCLCPGKTQGAPVVTSPQSPNKQRGPMWPGDFAHPQAWTKKAYEGIFLTVPPPLHPNMEPEISPGRESAWSDR